MSEKGQPDSEKLPWLEPYREPKTPRPRPRLREVKSAPVAPSPSPPPGPRRRRAIGSSAGASLGILAAAGLAFGGYWYGRQSVSDDSGSATAIVTPLPPVGAERPVLTYPSIENSAPNDIAGKLDTAVQGGREEKAAPTPTRPRASSPERLAAKVRGGASTRPPPPPVAAPPPPRPRAALAPSTVASVPPPRPRPRAAPAPVPLPGKPGRNLLLGYYASAGYADQARARIVKRYPYLGGLRAQVAPVSLGQGRGSMYALRLVARNGSDARALCKNLKGIGYGCTVQ